ncbi:ROK family protein [Limnochorda pilosa]|nr:ROK family protein [Limnochorda pilosa]
MVACGIDIGGTKIAGGLVTSSGRLLYREERPTLAHEGGSSVVARAREFTGELLARAAREGFVPVGVGAGSGGAISGGRVVGATSLIKDWTGVDLQAGIIPDPRLRVKVDNDVKAMAHAESLWGDAREARCAVVVALGTGVGGAIVVGGQVLEGADGLAGHLGHVPVWPDGPLCSCGNRGCLEAFISGTAIVKAAQTRLAQEGREERLANASAVWDAAQGDHPWARATIEEAARAFAMAFRGLVYTLNPDRIILAGRLSNWGEPFRQLLWRHLNAELPEHFSRNLSLSLSRWGSELGILGAAALVLEEMVK